VTPFISSIQGSYIVNGKELTISLPPEEFKWDSMDDKGRSLTPVSKGSGGGQGSPVIGETGQGVPVEFTSSVEGAYRVRISPKTRGKYVLEDDGTDRGTVVVRPPTVKEIVLKGPSNMVLKPGDRAQFEAWAFFEESCVPPKTNHPRSGRNLELSKRPFQGEHLHRPGAETVRHQDYLPLAPGPGSGGLRYDHSGGHGESSDTWRFGFRLLQRKNFKYAVDIGKVSGYPGYDPG